MTRMRTLRVAALLMLMLVACTLVPAQASPTVSRSYAQSTARASASGGWPLTPPPESANWSAVFTDDDVACWDNPYTSYYCFSRGIAFAWGGDSAAALCVSPAGVLWIQGEGDTYSCGQMHADKMFFPGFSRFPKKAQPEYRFVFDTYSLPNTLALFLGFAATPMWNASTQTMRYTQTADQFWMQGNLTSFTQGTKPPLPGVFRFTLCLHANQSIQLDVAALTMHDSADSTRTPTVGVQGGDSFTGTTSILAFASMWQPQSEGAVSARLDWDPYTESSACMAMLTEEFGCAQCLGLGGAPATTGCAWCDSTSSCVQANSPVAASCPSPPLTSSCPAIEYSSCASCTAVGYIWSSGDADCAVTANNTAALCNTSPAFSEWSEGEPVPTCVASASELPTITCDARYNTSFMSCGAATRSGPWPMHLWGCNCAPDALDTRVMGGPSNAPTCTQCTPQLCNSAWASEHMACGWEGGDPNIQCVCEETYYSLQGGRACNECKKIAYRDRDNLCKMCPSLSPALIAVFIIAAVLLTFFVVKLNSHPLIQRLLIPVSNAVVYCQVVSLLALVDFHWPLSVQRAFNAFTIAGFNLVSLPSATCYMTADEKFYLSLFALPVITAMLCLSMLAIMLRNCCCVVRGPATRLKAKAINSRFRILFVRSFLSVLLLLYNFLVYTTFEGLNNLNREQLRDLGWSHASAQDVLSVIATIVYVAGIPALFVVALMARSKRKWVAKWLQCARCCNREEQRNNVLQPLRGRYRPGMHYWEALFMPLWKIALNALIVWAPRTVQIVCIAVLLLAVMLAYARFKPYSSGLNNREQVWLLSGSLTILFSGVLFYFSSNRDSAALRAVQLLSYVIVAATMLVMGAVIVYVIASVTRQYFAELKGAAKLVGDEEWEQQPGHAVAASLVVREEDAETAVVPDAPLVDPELKLMGGSRALHESLLSEGQDDEGDDGYSQSVAQSVPREGIPEERPHVEAHSLN